MHGFGRRLVVRLVDVRQRHGLASVRFANELVVRQVDSDRRHRTRVAGFNHDLDGLSGDTEHVRFPETRIPRHVVLEPLRVGGERLDLARLLRVDVVHERFPGALIPRGSMYTSTNPLIVSTGESRSRTHAMSYCSRSTD